MPVLLDGGRLSSTIASFARIRAQPQLLLVALLVVAFVAIAAARLSGGGAATAGGAQPHGSAVAAAPDDTTPTPEPASSAPAAATSPSPTLPPTTNATRTYKVKRGDTLYLIARRFGTTVSTIQRLNHLGTSTTLHAGQVLKLP